MKREHEDAFKINIGVLMIICILLIAQTNFATTNIIQQTNSNKWRETAKSTTLKSKNNNFLEPLGDWHTIASNSVWNISTETVIENQNLIVTSDIIIESSGSLTLRNSILQMDTQNTAILIEVLEGGKLILINSTITSKDFLGGYVITVHNNATFYVENSEISYAGAKFEKEVEGVPPGAIATKHHFPEMYIPEVHGISYDDFYEFFHGRGLIIGAQNVTIRGSRIINVTGGILLVRSDNTRITNSLIEDCDVALDIWDSSFLVFENNTVTNCDEIRIQRISDSTISRSAIKNLKFYLYMDNCKNVIISKNTIEKIGGEFVISDSHNITISKNILKEINYTITLLHTYNVTFDRNVISGDIGIGVTISDCVLNNITNNMFFNQGIFLQGENESTFSTTVLKNNTVNGNPVIFVLKQKFSILQYNTTIGELIIALSEGITVTNLQIAGGRLGVEITHSKYIKLVNSSFRNTYKGVVIDTCRSVFVENTTFENCSVAIEAYQFSCIHIENNIVTNASIGIYCHTHYTWYRNILTRSQIRQNTIKFSHFAVLISKSETTLIENNTIANNDYGIVVEHSPSRKYMIVARNNNISENQYGIVTWYINNFTVRDNTISNNEYGIFAEYSTNIRIINNTITNNHVAIYIKETSDLTLSNNVLKNNTITLQKIIIESKVLSLVENLIVVWLVLSAPHIYKRHLAKKKKRSFIEQKQSFNSTKSPLEH